ncbi:MAG TPA: hypothetical protein VNW92_13880 [Polyangiaceae bacterium]|nr:hypothetical protein [Polyangiaceae bacterium]
MQFQRVDDLDAGLSKTALSLTNLPFVDRRLELGSQKERLAGQVDAIYIDRMPLLPGGKRVLVVLFVPSVERDGKTAVDQDLWVRRSLEMFGGVFGVGRPTPRRRAFGETTKEPGF